MRRAGAAAPKPQARRCPLKSPFFDNVSFGPLDAPEQRPSASPSKPLALPISTRTTLGRIIWLGGNKDRTEGTAKAVNHGALCRVRGQNEGYCERSQPRGCNRGTRRGI